MKNSERTQQTKYRIGSAFMELRKRNSLDRIRITELCQLAKTNRTTFYHYFEDIYALNDAVEDAIIQDCLKDFPYRGMIYDDPDRYLSGFFKCMETRKTELEILAQGREPDQGRKMERWLIELGKKENGNIDEEFFLTFIIGGIIHTNLMNRKTASIPKNRCSVSWFV
ncbi:MAG: TetR/AcrR family transcriptional regulator [Solobacterium sp.]|nr:TetR/AcrR family transcriptional regulator [Solobacterium sp.]